MRRRMVEALPHGQGAGWLSGHPRAGQSASLEIEVLWKPENKMMRKIERKEKERGRGQGGRGGREAMTREEERAGGDKTLELLGTKTRFSHENGDEDSEEGERGRFDKQGRGGHGTCLQNSQRSNIDENSERSLSKGEMAGWSHLGARWPEGRTRGKADLARDPS